MTLPRVYREFPTLEKLQAGHSIARFGDGELRLALGMSVGHQAAHKKLQEELNYILYSPKTKCLVGIPYVDKASPLVKTWQNYSAPKYQKLYNPEKEYYSAFITRPDSAPWIDNPLYWQAIKELYINKDVIIVCGSAKGFRYEEMENDCKSLKLISTLSEQAYEEIDNIEKEIGTDTTKTVLLAVGATATVLSSRLCERGFHAMDLGHVAMFMRRRGLFKNA